MDTRGSFTIEGWDSEETFAPISYRHQLKGFQNMTSKTNNLNRHKQFRLDRLGRKEKNDDSSFLSLKTHQKCYTQ